MRVGFTGEEVEQVCLFTRADEIHLDSPRGFAGCRTMKSLTVAVTALTGVQWAGVLRASPSAEGVDLSWCPHGKQLL